LRIRAFENVFRVICLVALLLVNHLFIDAFAQSYAQSSTIDNIAGFKLNKIVLENKVPNINGEKKTAEVSERNYLQFLQPAKVLTNSHSNNPKAVSTINKSDFNSTEVKVIENSMIKKNLIPQQPKSVSAASKNLVKPIETKLQVVIPEKKETVNAPPPVKPVEVATDLEAKTGVEQQKTDFYSDKFDKLPKELEKSKEATPPSYFSMLTSLFIVIVLIFIFGWAYNRLKEINPALLLSGKQYDKKANRFNLISTASLGQGKSIHLVEINGKRLILGSTANNVNLLSELPDELKSFNDDASQQDSENQQDNTADAQNYENGYSDLYKEYINKSEKQV